MSLSEATFPDANWDGNEQDTSNDGAADSSLAQAGGYNEHSSEVLEMQRLLRGKVAAAHAGAVMPIINKTGGTLACGKMVKLDGYDATTGLPKAVLTVASPTVADCRELLGLLVMEKGGDVDTVADNEVGYVLGAGAAYGQVTDGFSADVPLWLGASGALTATPAAGLPPVARCDVSHATLGVLHIMAPAAAIMAAGQSAHVADPSGGGTQDAEARSAINSILALLERFGMLAAS